MEQKLVFYPNPNPNGRKLVDCLDCGKRKELHAKGMCYACYKQRWQPAKIRCENCLRIKPHKAFGLCGSCHTRLHHYDKILAYNAKKYFGLDLEAYKKLTKECVCCGFNKIVELHHLNCDKNNNATNNLIPFCSNCHKMIHTHKYYKEILIILKKKGYNVDNIRPRKLE